MPLADYQDLVDDLVRDDTGKITTADRDEAIARAVARYSQDRPKIKVEDVTADGTYFLPLPAAWETDFSQIRSIEYPIGKSPLSIIDNSAWGMYQAPSAEQIILADVIATGKSVRINYTIRRVVDGSSDTIRADDREPVSAWAAAFLLDQLASLFSGDSDSTIQADNVDHNSKARDFASRAKTLRKRYYDELGIDPKRSVAAGAVVDLDMNDSQGNDRLMHPRRYR